MTAAKESHPPPSSSRFHLTTFQWRLALIVAGGFVLRLVVLVLSRHERVTGDGYEWSKQGNLNAAGHWFVSAFNLRPDALRPPGWALVLTVWAWLGQHTWFRQQLLASLIGTATVLVVALAARRISGERAAVVAGLIAAVYPGFWVYERALLSETLLLLGVSAMTLLAYRFRARPSMAAAAVLGVGTGLLALTRSEQILLLALLVLPLIAGRRQFDLRTRGIWLAIATACVLVVVIPWTIFNLGRFQKPVFLSNGFGAAAATGNCNLAYYGPEIGYGDLRCLPLFVKGDQSVQDGEDAHTALRYAEGHLSRLPLVVFAREGRTFGFWNPAQQTGIDATWMGTWIGVTRLEMLSYWLLLVPAVAGLVALRRRRIMVYPLMAFVLTTVVAVAPAIGDPRYRAAADVPLVLLAATGIDAAIGSRRRSARQPTHEPDLQPEDMVRVG